MNNEPAMTQNETKTNKKKIGSIVLNILLYFFLAICVIAVVLTLVSKKDADGAITIFGMQIRRVLTPSMDKCDQTDVSDFDIGSIPANSAIFVKVMPDDPKEIDEWYANLKVGDVLTFRYVYTQQVTITHRIDKIEKNNDGGYSIYLSGDNKNEEGGTMTQLIDTSVENSPNYVIGKVTGQSILLGLLLTLMASPIGIVLVVMLPCLIIIVLEIIRIYNVLTSDRKIRAEEERIKKDQEIEELRRRLAALEQPTPDQESKPTEEE